MACGLSKSLGLSSSLEKQGIVTILGGECERDISSNTSAASLRRTFSADMSSKNWLNRNGFCPMKTISSSEELLAYGADSLSSSDEELGGGGGGGGGEGSRSGFDIWAQIQEEKKNKKTEEERPGQLGVWSSILSQKSEPIKMVPPPYVHPIVKRTSSSLSEKSLEICTESLGSETGSDVFSWCPSPETGDAEDQKGNNQDEPQKVVMEAKEEKPEAEQETWVANCNSDSTICEKPSRGGLFPPPIPSLSSQSGKSLHMKTCRNNGRLVLEAVSMPSQNNFCAKRQEGRLVLTFADPKEETQDTNEREEGEDEETNSEILWFNEEEEEVEEDSRNGLVSVKKSAHKPNGLVSVHRLAFKPIGVPNRNPRWPHKEVPDGKSEVSAAPIAQSLPPRPRVAQLARAAQPPSTVDDTVGAACFNTYDYYWRPTKPIIDTKPTSPNTTTQFQAQFPLKNPAVSAVISASADGGGGGHDGWLNGCKEQRRSLLFFEPFCIATS